MLDTDPDLINDDVDPDELGPELEDLEKLEEGDDDAALDDFGEPPTSGSAAAAPFGRLRP